MRIISLAPSPNLSLCLEYVRRGWPLIPLHYRLANGHCSCQSSSCRSIAKHPWTKSGLNDATLDEGQIRQWWQQRGSSNIGIVTGKCSGLFVLDIDPRHGGDQSLEQLKSEIPAIDNTLTVKTGGDGLHLYFALPEAVPIPKSRVNLLPGVDIRCHGGYVVAPGSMHASGKTYEWEDKKQPLSILPSGLINLAAHKTKPYGPKPTRYTKSRQPSEVSSKNLKPFKEGSRNSSLTRLAGFLVHIGVKEPFLTESLRHFNESFCHPSLDLIEVDRIARGMSRYVPEPWPEPRPLISQYPSGPELDTAIIPQGFKPWIQDVAERMGCPPEFVTAATIVSFSSTVGRQVSIYPKAYDNWLVIPNLWGAVIAPPGSMKSPALSAGLAPLKAAAEELKGSLGFITSDATLEKLLILMKSNPEGILLFRDELTGWLQTMNRSGREGEREFYLESWNGSNPYTMDRVARGRVHVDAMCLSVLGGIQPGNQRLQNDSNQDGLFQRFQILIQSGLKKVGEGVDREPDHQAFRLATKIYKDALVGRSHDNTPRTLRCEPRASDALKKLLVTWDKKAKKHSETMPSLALHLSKYSSLAPSLALLFQLIEDPASSRVNLDSVESAAAWCVYLENHAKIFYSNLASPTSTVSAQALAAKVREGKVYDGMTMREIYRKCWKNLETPLKCSEAYECLEHLHWLRTNRQSHHKEVILVNPSIRGRK